MLAHRSVATIVAITNSRDKLQEQIIWWSEHLCCSMHCTSYQGHTATILRIQLLGKLQSWVFCCHYTYTDQHQVQTNIIPVAIAAWYCTSCLTPRSLQILQVWLRKIVYSHVYTVKIVDDDIGCTGSILSLSTLILFQIMQALPVSTQLVTLLQLCILCISYSMILTGVQDTSQSNSKMLCATCQRFQWSIKWMPSE